MEKMSKVRAAWNESNLISPAEIHARLRKTNLGQANVIENSKIEPIKSDLYRALIPIYHLSKICGLLPVRFSPTGRGLYSGKLSKIETLYGFLLVLVFITTQSWGLWRDLRHGWKNSTRLSSNTAVTVTCSDVISVAGVVFVAILSFPFRWKYLQKTMNKLTEIDEKIGIVTIKKLQRKAIILTTCTLGFITVISVCDYFTWLHSNKKKHLSPRVDRGPINYTPIYLMYFVITVFNIQYALASFHIGERFVRMNQIIERFLKSYKISNYFKKDLGLVGEFKHQRQMASIVASDVRNLPGRETKVFDWLVAGNDNQCIADGISLLITLHGNLCQSTLLLNSGFGIPLLFSILSCLLHLIITPYFVYIEVHDENCSYRVIIMQILWIVFHAMGLLVTVQPCYWSCVQAKETGVIISELLTLKWDTEIRKQLEIFSLQMLHRPLEFSACGLFFMDRALVTSIAGAVTTYLVILIQFQSGDDDDQNVALKNATEILKTLTANVLKNP